MPNIDPDQIAKVLDKLGYLFKILVEQIHERNRIEALKAKIPEEVKPLPSELDGPDWWERLLKEPGSVDELPSDPSEDLKE